MNNADYLRAKKLSKQLASFGSASKVKEVKKTSNSLDFLNNLSGFPKKKIKTPYFKPTPVKVLKEKVYLGAPGKKGDKGDSIKGDPGYTPIKGLDYFDGKTPTTEELEAIMLPHIEKAITGLKQPEAKEEFSVNEDMVREIIKIMHSLPEQDKLEVSKGIRNAQSFIFNKTKYETSELMHGGGSSGSGGVTIITISGTIDDSNVNFTATSEPTLLNINGGFYQQTGGAITWTYLAGAITLSSPVGTGGSIYGLA